MNGFLLDTNVLSEFSRTGKPDEQVDRWLKSAPDESLFASVLTLGEIRRGIELLPSGKRRIQLEHGQDDLVSTFESRLFPVTLAIAGRCWAVVSAQSQRKGIALRNIDGLIAATALEHDLTLATRNVKDFAGIDVPLFNPWEVCSPSLPKIRNSASSALPASIRQPVRSCSTIRIWPILSA